MHEAATQILPRGTNLAVHELAVIHVRCHCWNSQGPPLRLFQTSLREHVILFKVAHMKSLI